MKTKFMPPKSKPTSIRAAIRIPKRMLDQVHLDMEAMGYNSKERNTWINQAINTLLEIEDCHQLVAEEFIESGTNQPIPVVIPQAINEEINEKIDLLKQESNIDKDRSSFIRTAIIQRLIRSTAGQFFKPGNK